MSCHSIMWCCIQLVSGFLPSFLRRKEKVQSYIKPETKGNDFYPKSSYPIICVRIAAKMKSCMNLIPLYGSPQVEQTHHEPNPSNNFRVRRSHPRGRYNMVTIGVVFAKIDPPHDMALKCLGVPSTCTNKMYFWTCYREDVLPQPSMHVSSNMGIRVRPAVEISKFMEHVY